MSATLASLRIRNLALVEDLLWEPPSGFVAVTGETGAGKSVILGAVKLLLGERADKSLIRTGADTCTVEGVFAVEAASRVHAIVENGGAEPCEDGQLILKRTITAAGTGKQFVNGSPCTLPLLRELGDVLVDLHGPHDHQSLFSKDEQGRLLDAFADATALLADYQRERREWLRLVSEEETLTRDAEALAREIDLLGHQVNEITSAELKAGEEDVLLARQRSGANSHRLAEICGEIEEAVSGSDSALASGLTELVRLAREMQRLDETAAPIHAAATAMFEAAQDLARDAARHAGGLESDPEQLAAIEARLDLIQSLKRKYGATVAEVIAFGETAAEKLAALKSREARSSGLGAEIAAASERVRVLGAKLTKARAAAAPKLAKIVKSQLGDLGFLKSGFSIGIEAVAEPGPSGFESVEFLFAPNPGEPERPLRSIASSGEISRVMLALKSSLAGQDGVPVLIFDEIDANVGGEIGARVGAKMRELAKSHQVFCITHLPQVAACAGAHFVVTKTADDHRTRTNLVPADGAAREAEIARMLGGDGASARQHARTLLAGK